MRSINRWCAINNVKDLLIYKILRECKNCVLGIAKSPYFCARAIRLIIEDYLEDKRLGIETYADNYYLDKDTSRHRDMYGYGTTPYSVLKSMIKRIKPGRDDVFIDFGCGKGRVICMMATQPVKKIIGVELNAEIAKMAKENIAKLKAHNAPVEVMEVDAAGVDVSEGTLFFMYTPFGSNTTSHILANIKNSLETSPRMIRFIYYSPQCAALLDSQDWLVPEGEIGKTNVFVWRSK